MNFLISLKKGEKITPDKPSTQYSVPVYSTPSGPIQLPRSEPHIVSDPNTSEAKAYSEQYWKNRQQILPTKSSKSYGGVVVNEAGQFLLREPSNHYDGYVWTWPKGASHVGESETATALREVEEETGWQCSILREQPLGEFFNASGFKSVFYLMKPIKQFSLPDRETQNICWAEYEEAKLLIGRSKNSLGRLRDLTALNYAHEALKTIQKL
jgi:8-oxo-dGTP diphosphatase